MRDGAPGRIHIVRDDEGLKLDAVSGDETEQVMASIAVPYYKPKREKARQ